MFGIYIIYIITISFYWPSWRHSCLWFVGVTVIQVPCILWVRGPWPHAPLARPPSFENHWFNHLVLYVRTQFSKNKQIWVFVFPLCHQLCTEGHHFVLIKFVSLISVVSILSREELSVLTAKHEEWGTMENRAHQQIDFFSENVA